MTKLFLRTDEYLPFAPENTGQIHVNHEGCDAGVDTKKRLYIRRLDHDGLVLAYCHHCGKSGSYRPSVFIRKPGGSSNELGLDNGSKGGKGAGVKLPTDYDADIGHWPSQAKAWLYSFYLTDEDIKRGRIGYSNFLRRLVLPVFQSDGVAYYQTRRLFDDDEAPKYLTRGDVRDQCHIIESIVPSNHSVCVVEDVVSGLRVSHYMDALVLHGTELSYKHLEEVLTRQYERCIIFLDNDNPTVIGKGIEMARKMERVVDKVNRVITATDPKRLGPKALEQEMTR